MVSTIVPERQHTSGIGWLLDSNQRTPLYAGFVLPAAYVPSRNAMLISVRARRSASYVMSFGTRLPMRAIIPG